MARINIEDGLWSDPRFMRLCIKLGDEMRAVGAVVIAWKVAQKYWCPDKQAIPNAAFESAALPIQLVEVGLAESIASGIRMRGSEEHFAWWFQRQEAGRKGGESKASKTKQPLATASDRLAKGSDRLANGSGAKQKVPSYSSSYSSSSSNSSSIANLGNSPTKTKDFVVAYCDRFKDRWGENAQIMGKDAGIAKRLAKDLSLDRFKYLLDAYFSMPDAWLVKIKHPLATFELKLSEIVVYAGSGLFTSNREAQQADGSVSNMHLLQKIKDGEL